MPPLGNKKMRYIQRETDRSIGTNIATIRKELGFSQETLANELGISRRAIGSYECGERSIPVFLIPKLSNILHVSAIKLLNIKTPILDERTKEAKILRELEKVNKLPEEDRKVIFTLIDSFSSKQAALAK